MTSKQRAYLKGLAMKMEPIMQLGKGSVTPENTCPGRTGHRTKDRSVPRRQERKEKDHSSVTSGRNRYGEQTKKNRHHGRNV